MVIAVASVVVVVVVVAVVVSVVVVAMVLVVAVVAVSAVVLNIAVVVVAVDCSSFCYSLFLLLFVLLRSSSVAYITSVAFFSRSRCCY